MSSSVSVVFSGFLVFGSRNSNIGFIRIIEIWFG